MAWPRAACATGTGWRLAAASTSREGEEGEGAERDSEVFCWKLVEVNHWRKQNRKYEIRSKFEPVVFRLPGFGVLDRTCYF
jgi:hypothetical protein